MQCVAPAQTTKRCPHPPFGDKTLPVLSRVTNQYRGLQKVEWCIRFGGCRCTTCASGGSASCMSWQLRRCTSATTAMAVRLIGGRCLHLCGALMPHASVHTIHIRGSLPIAGAGNPYFFDSAYGIGVNFGPLAVGQVTWCVGSVVARLCQHTMTSACGVQ